MKKSGQLSLENLMGLAPAPLNKMTESELSNYTPQYLDKIDTSFILTPNDSEILNVLLYLGECGFSINYDKIITKENKPITAKDLKADGALTVLLKDSINPNLRHTPGDPLSVQIQPIGWPIDGLLFHTIVFFFHVHNPPYN